jgi:hypothetical protein
MLRITRNIIIFVIPFSAIFWWVHENYDLKGLLLNLGGLPWLYSTIGLIFGILVAFVIQREWESWTNLDEAVRTEVDMLREMWQWSTYTTPAIAEKIQNHLRFYIEAIIAEWGDGSGTIKRSNRIDAELDALRHNIVDTTAAVGGAGAQLHQAFANLVTARNRRLSFSNEHMPTILLRAVIFADFLVIILSLFIGVPNIFLDYAFTLSIGLLAFSLFTVVEDLDNPFRPGTWHLTTAIYKELLHDLTGE